jgi:SAM-dependent methyltransferase
MNDQERSGNQCARNDAASLRSQLRLPLKSGSARFGRRLCKVCDANDWKGDDWLQILDEMNLSWQRAPSRRTRKAWEWVHGMYGLRKLGFLNQRATALGVGAGKEFPLYYLANHVNHVLATDVYGGTWAGPESPREMLEHPESFAPFTYRKDRLSVRYMDGRRLELEDNSFDVAFSFSSIEHFGGHSAAKQALCEMGRVVRPGGVVVVSTELILNGQPHPEYFLPDQLYQELIEPSGLSLVEDIDFSISDETLATPIVEAGRAGWSLVTPHFIIRQDRWLFTSVIFFLGKPHLE